MVIATQQITGVINRTRSNSFIESYLMVVKQAKSCAAQDVEVEYKKGETNACNYELSNDYDLLVKCGTAASNADECHIILTVAREDYGTAAAQVTSISDSDIAKLANDNGTNYSGKFKTMNLAKYGDASKEKANTNPTEYECDKTAISTTVKSCGTKFIHGYFDR